MSFCKRLSAAAILSLIWISLSASKALAQIASDAPTESLKTHHAMAYGLVLLGIVLGLTNVVRPGKRKGEKQKPA